MASNNCVLARTYLLSAGVRYHLGEFTLSRGSPGVDTPMVVDGVIQAHAAHQLWAASRYQGNVRGGNRNDSHCENLIPSTHELPLVIATPHYHNPTAGCCKVTFSCSKDMPSRPTCPCQLCQRHAQVDSAAANSEPLSRVTVNDLGKWDPYGPTVRCHRAIIIM